MDWYLPYFKYLYLLTSLAAFFLLSLVYLLSKDKNIRQAIIIGGIITIPVGLISQVYFLRDYWQPESVPPLWFFNLEDIITAFTIGGFSFIADVVFKKKFTAAQKRRLFLIPLFYLYTIISFYILTNQLQINSIYSSSIAYFVFALLLFSLRKDLIWIAFLEGLSLMLAACFFYLPLLFIFPSYASKIMLFPQDQIIFLLDIPHTEYIWYFSFGLVFPTLYKTALGIKN